MSRELLAFEHEQPTLDRVVELALEVVPAAEHVGISLRVGKGTIETLASSGRLVEAADELQYELDEGPCVASTWNSETYLAHDTRVDPRWPRWGPRVAEHGLLSVLSVQLVQSDGQPLGAVNLYATAPNVYGREDVDSAHVLAHHASGALETLREIDGLRFALHSRHVIGVAQGMLMQRYGLSLDRAFDVLLRQSQETNTKLRDIATALVSQGRLPDVGEDHHENLKIHSVAFDGEGSGR